MPSVPSRTPSNFPCPMYQVHHQVQVPASRSCIKCIKFMHHVSSSCSCLKFRLCLQVSCLMFMFLPALMPHARARALMFMPSWSCVLISVHHGHAHALMPPWTRLCVFCVCVLSLCGRKTPVYVDSCHNATGRVYIATHA